MKIAMIAAMAKNRVIGLDNEMPWHLPDDLKFFKAKTTGKPVIMGRKTFESIGSKPLPNRPNIVISRNSELELNGVTVFDSVESALATLNDYEEVIIMGGGQLYSQMLPFADRLYLTLIDAEIQGDTLFPDWRGYEWKTVELAKHDKDERHAYAFEFITLDKV
ncbi:type 3 dihydrofolate reductase [Thiomicrorhabdus chilensis]|uniref:type 3 dihydrofolate reductase n=1 Tax=Thiomicrorhabdus chilensis TaxID=63656 RepID=UPI0003F693AA|nr:type 3 dihydrofolate reductase [Thiomicrorhabdus chilensis]